MAKLDGDLFRIIVPPRDSVWRCSCGFQGPYHSVRGHRISRSRGPDCYGHMVPSSPATLAGRMQRRAWAASEQARRNLLRSAGEAVDLRTPDGIVWADSPGSGWTPPPTPEPPPAISKSEPDLPDFPEDGGDDDNAEDESDNHLPVRTPIVDEAELIARRLLERMGGGAAGSPSANGAGYGGAPPVPRFPVIDGSDYGFGGSDDGFGDGDSEFRVHHPDTPGPVSADSVTVTVPIYVMVMFDWARQQGWNAGNGTISDFVADCLMDHFANCWGKTVVVANRKELVHAGSEGAE